MTRRQMLRAFFGAPFAASAAAFLPLVAPARWREHVGFMDTKHPDARNARVFFNGVEVSSELYAADSQEGTIRGWCTDDMGAKRGWHCGRPTHPGHVFERGRLQEFIARSDVRIVVGPTPAIPKREAAWRLRDMLPQARASVSAVPS